MRWPSRASAHGLDQQRALDFLDAFMEGRFALRGVLLGHLDHALRDDRTGVDAVVDEVDGQPVTLTPYASASRTPWAPGKLGSRAGWVLTVRPPKAARNAGPTIFMKPADTTRSGRCSATSAASASSHAPRSRGP
ncbi:hypothetical protein SCALM49S_06109 [Streptomyces californicus]